MHHDHFEPVFLVSIDVFLHRHSLQVPLFFIRYFLFIQLIGTYINNTLTLLGSMLCLLFLFHDLYERSMSVYSDRLQIVPHVVGFAHCTYLLLVAIHDFFNTVTTALSNSPVVIFKCALLQQLLYSSYAF